MGEGWGVLAAVLSSGLGGTSIGATRYLVNAIDPLAIGSFRFGIGFLLLLPVALLQGGVEWPRQDWPGVAGLGVLYFALFPILFNASLIFTTAGAHPSAGYACAEHQISSRDLDRRDESREVRGVE